MSNQSFIGIDSQLSTSIEASFVWLVCLVGSVSNSLVFMSSWANKYSQKFLQSLIAFQSFIDFFVCSVYTPTYTFFALFNTDTDNIDFICKFAGKFFVILTSIGLTLQLLISIYLNALALSKKSRKFFPSQSAIAYIICIIAFNGILGERKIIKK